MASRAAERVKQSALWQRFVARRYRIQATVDGGAWALALTFATVARYDFRLDLVDWQGLALLVPLAALAQVVAGLVVGLYIGRWRFGSFEEVAALARATAMTTLLILALDLWVGTPRMVPISAALAGGVAALVLMAAVRYAWRLTLERHLRPSSPDVQRTLVFGAGEGGAQVVGAMLRDPHSPYLPVALLDDDPGKRNLRLMGVQMAGTRRDVRAAAEKHDATVLLVAIPSASAELVSEMTEAGASAGLDVKVLPSVTELFGAGVRLADIRDVTEADLLGRHEIDTDIDAIAGYLTDRRVLVTGAGGSIGSELCRQIYRFAPAELIMLDRDETGLHAVQMAIEGRALLDSPNLVLADIRDVERVLEVFEEYRPEVVFHAAALKHLPLLERHPAEAVKTNVWGTIAVLSAAAATGVERFVNISTDKAADPVSVLGHSKRIAERLTAHFASGDGTYLSVRFGNVLGSRGSMLGAFHSQIDAGGPITVTDPNVTRYFMTVQEAVQLVIQAAAIGRNGESLVLDMGEPVRIADVAKRLAAAAPRPVEIVYTGLRPGEKMHEALFGEGELDVRPVHPRISHVRVPPLAPAEAWALDAFGSKPASRLAELSRRTVDAGAVDLR